MPDQRATHAPYVDDSMAAEVESLTRGAPVESRAQEFRMAEPPDDDVEIDAIIDFASEPVPGALGEAERRQRSELAIALRPHAFPGRRDELLRVAERERAPHWILAALERLPIDARFDTPQEVWVALGGHREVRDANDATEVESAPTHSVADFSPGRATAPASTGLWNELRLLGSCIARLPLAVVQRAARTAIGMVSRS
jgi:hypothetical protein